MKATKNKTVEWHFRVAEDVDKEIIKIAEKNKISKSALIEKLVLRFLARIDYIIEDEIIDVYCREFIKDKESEPNVNINEVE